MSEGKIDLSKLMPQKKVDATESPAGNTPLVATIASALKGETFSVETAQKAEQSMRVRPQATVGTKPSQKKGRRYFFSQRPNMGIIISSNLRVRFSGNYFDTDDDRIAEFVKKHSGLIEEITEEQNETGHTKLD